MPAMFMNHSPSNGHEGSSVRLVKKVAPLQDIDGIMANEGTQSDAPTAEYREYPAPFPLKTHLMCLWTQSVRPSGDPFAHRVLPDTCIDIVFVNDELPVVVGPYTESFIAHLRPGTSIIGARFHPGRRAFAFLGHPASALLNQAVPVDALWSKAACSEFVSPVCEATSVAGRLAALGTALMNWPSRAGSIDLAVVAGIKWLADNPDARVEQLSGRIGISNRQFRRRFSAAVGYCPKIFQEVLRFQYLLNRATHAEDRPRLADLSADAGYADQAHMTREVHRFSDISPTELLGSARCTLRLSGLIKIEPSL